MAIVRIRSIVLDCPAPRALAGFYQRLLGGGIDGDADADWVVLTVDGRRLAFQRAEGFVPPRWPRGDHSQQVHLDLEADDIAAREAQVLAAGATVLDGDDAGGTRDFRVYADPAGHPFCLVRPATGDGA